MAPEFYEVMSCHHLHQPGFLFLLTRFGELRIYMYVASCVQCDPLDAVGGTPVIVALDDLGHVGLGGP